MLSPPGEIAFKTYIGNILTDKMNAILIRVLHVHQIENSLNASIHNQVLLSSHSETIEQWHCFSDI